MRYILFLFSAAFLFSTVQIVSASLSGAEAHASKRKHTHRKAHRINPKRLDPRRRNDPTGRYDGYPGWAAEAFTRHIDGLSDIVRLPPSAPPHQYPSKQCYFPDRSAPFMVLAPPCRRHRLLSIASDQHGLPVLLGCVPHQLVELCRDDLSRRLFFIFA